MRLVLLLYRLEVVSEYFVRGNGEGHFESRRLHWTETMLKVPGARTRPFLRLKRGISGQGIKSGIVNECDAT